MLQELLHCWVPDLAIPGQNLECSDRGFSQVAQVLTHHSLCDDLVELDLGTLIITLVQVLLYKALEVEKCWALFDITRSLPASVQGNKSTFHHLQQEQTWVQPGGLQNGLPQTYPRCLATGLLHSHLFPFCKLLLKKKKKQNKKSQRKYSLHYSSGPHHKSAWFTDPVMQDL